LFFQIFSTPTALSFSRLTPPVIGDSEYLQLQSVVTLDYLVLIIVGIENMLFIMKEYI